MKKLRALRTAIKYTQKDLAEKLNVSQQTIARWETGKAEPNIAALRDIALIFGTSVDDLLDIEKGHATQITTNHYSIFGGKLSDGFWGHLGLLLPGKEKTQWYPISVNEANRLGSLLDDRSSHDSNWVVASTLNNRMLVFSISAIKRICLLDDNLDPLEDDWDLSWDGYQGHSLEIYRALEDDFYASKEEYEKNYSQSLREEVKYLIEKHEIDEEKLTEYILDTHIHFIEGTSTHYCVEYAQLESLAYEAEMEENLGVFRLDNWNGRQFYYSANTVCLVDMPLLKYLEGRKEIDEDATMTQKEEKE